MGYRSEVRAIIYGTKDQMDAFVTAHALIFTTPVFEHFGENLKRYRFKSHVGDSLECLDLHGDDWKWYDSYPDVQAWMSFMRDAPNMGLEFEFIRVGEGDGNDQDVESENSAEAIFLLSTSRPQIHDEIDREEEDLPLHFGSKAKEP